MPERNISYAQNGEDIVLWRALGDIPQGVYVDVGANHPTDDSVTRKFYDAGWRGLAVEPNPEFATAFRRERPEDAVLEAVIAEEPGESVPFHVVDGTGLSTLVDEIGDRHRAAGYAVSDIRVPAVTLNEAIRQSGLDGGEIHFMVVDTEGAEATVLASIDFSRHRPWVLVIEATEPLSSTPSHDRWEQVVLGARYRFCLFDGLSRFYVAEEHAEKLASHLSYSAGILDSYTPIAAVRLQEQVEELAREVANLSEDRHQLTLALADCRTEAEGAHTTIKELRGTLSWRITKPLRALKRFLRR